MPDTPDNEPLVHGLPARLFDGYDGGKEPSPESITQLLANAPPKLRARAEEYERERQARAQK